MPEPQLAAIPDKTYFTIGEVSKLCDVQETVLRYWQERFRQLNPVRRRGRRYYQRKDIELIRRIRDLLYVKGYTINGAKKVLSEGQPSAQIIEHPVSAPMPQENPVAVPVQQAKREATPVFEVPAVESVVEAAPVTATPPEPLPAPVAEKKAAVNGMLADLQSLLEEVK